MNNVKNIHPAIWMMIIFFFFLSLFQIFEVVQTRQELKRRDLSLEKATKENVAKPNRCEVVVDGVVVVDFIASGKVAPQNDGPNCATSRAKYMEEHKEINFR